MTIPTITPDMLPAKAAKAIDDPLWGESDLGTVCAFLNAALESGEAYIGYTPGMHSTIIIKLRGKP